MASTSRFHNFIPEELHMIKLFLQMAMRMRIDGNQVMANSFFIDPIEEIEEQSKKLNNSIDVEEILNKYINYMTGEPLLHIYNNDPMDCFEIEDDFRVNSQEFRAERAEEKADLLNRIEKEPGQELVANLSSYTNEIQHGSNPGDSIRPIRQNSTPHESPGNVHLQEHVAKLRTEETASTNSIGKEPGQELVDNLSSQANEIQHDSNVYLQEHVAKLRTEETASINPIGKEPGQELVANPSSQANGID